MCVLIYEAPTPLIKGRIDTTLHPNNSFSQIITGRC